MMESAAEDKIRELDPFGFWPGHGSAIRPLGGNERGLDPRYVFHTPYVEYLPGRLLFSIRFDKLQASFGELRVFVNAFVPGSGRDAVFVTSSRLDLTDRIAVERGLTISILTVAGASYAVHGICTEGTDARAAGLAITAEQIEAPEDGSKEGFLLPTSLGTNALQVPGRLVDNGAARFADPVSQVMTPGQLAETDYQQWIARLPNRPDDSGARWKLAFIAQVLDRYGMLRVGGRGIALGDGSAALAPVIAAAGCEAVTAALPPEHHVSDFSWSAVLCTPLDSSGAPGAPLSLSDEPAATRGFDFLWSMGLAELGYAAGHCANFLIELMTVLRPGGYAVHMLDLAPPGSGVTHALPRAEVERLAVTLISRGFTVAQLNFSGLAGAEAAVPFGLIVRKD